MAVELDTDDPEEAGLDNMGYSYHKEAEAEGDIPGEEGHSPEVEGGAGSNLATAEQHHYCTSSR